MQDIFLPKYAQWVNVVQVDVVWIVSERQNPLWVDVASEDAGGQTVKVITS